MNWRMRWQVSIQRRVIDRSEVVRRGGFAVGGFEIGLGQGQIAGQGFQVFVAGKALEGKEIAAIF